MDCPYVLTKQQKNVWTRGDGEFGQKSNEHYKLIQKSFKI